MGALLCCFRGPEREERHTSDEGERVFEHHTQNDNFPRKDQEERLRNYHRTLASAHRLNSSSCEIEFDPFNTSFYFESKSQTIDGSWHDLSDDEDACPICLEGYTDHNPRTCLQCSHEFHLGCIYEWMERSAACPFCDEMMLFEEET